MPDIYRRIEQLLCAKHLLCEVSMSCTFTDHDAREFADARIHGRKRAALRVLHRVTAVQYKDYSFERESTKHQAPSPTNGAPLWDVAANDVYPEDIYGPNALTYYGTGDTDLDSAALDVIRAAEGLVGAHLTVYRAIEKGAECEITPGDWVTPLWQYAENHGSAHISGDYEILSARVITRDLFTNGDSWLEWGYHPQPPLPRLIPGILTLHETLEGKLNPCNELFTKLTDEMRESVVNHDAFVQAINVYAKFRIGLTNGTEFVTVAQESGQFEAELQAVRKNKHTVYVVTPELASMLAAHGEKLSVIGNTLLWQKNTENLGADPVIQKIVAERSPAAVNDIVLKVLPTAVSLYEFAQTGAAKEMDVGCHIEQGR